jgi:hypothetical protein
MWLTLLLAMGDTASAIKAIKAATELEVGWPLNVLRTNNDREFTVKEFTAYCSDEGVQRHFSALYTTQQNEVVERWNQTILGMAHTLLKECGMPVRFGGEAVTTTVFLLNCAPTKALRGKTLFEAYHGRKPVVGFLKTFNYVGFIKNKRPGLKKLDDQSVPMVFIGYSEGAKAYRMLEPSTGASMFPAMSSSTRIEDGSRNQRQVMVTLWRNESTLSGTTLHSHRWTMSNGMCPRRARSHHPLGRQHRCQTRALHRRWSCRCSSLRHHLKMTRTDWMRSTMNPLFATGGWIAS